MTVDGDDALITRDWRTESELAVSRVVTRKVGVRDSEWTMRHIGTSPPSAGVLRLGVRIYTAGVQSQDVADRLASDVQKLAYQMGARVSVSAHFDTSGWTDSSSSSSSSSSSASPKELVFDISPSGRAAVRGCVGALFKLALTIVLLAIAREAYLRVFSSP